MYSYKYPHPAVAADICIFTVRPWRLSLLLIQRAAAPFKEMWALPGGFLRMDEDLDSCARRELEEETGVRAGVLHHFGIFSEPLRDPRERVISVAYLTMVKEEQVRLSAGSDAADAQWHDLAQLPDLAFDHGVIVARAWDALKDLARREPIAMSVLPERFTLSELQRVHELIEGTALDKRNFRSEVERKGWVRETGDKVRGHHRPAMLYERAFPAAT